MLLAHDYLYVPLKRLRDNPDYSPVALDVVTRFLCLTSAELEALDTVIGEK